MDPVAARGRRHRIGRYGGPQVAGGGRTRLAGGTLDSQLRAQREAHERQMEEELQRQHRQLSSDHERELDEMRVRLTTQHVSEMNAMRSDLTAAREASRSASSTGQNAAREAKLDAEKQRGALEAQHRSELKEAQQKIAALEKAVKEAGPLLSQAAQVLPPAHQGSLGAKLSAAQRACELALPGSAPRAQPPPPSAAPAPAAPAPAPLKETKPMPGSPAWLAQQAASAKPPAAAPAAPAPAPPPSSVSKYGRQSLDAPPPPVAPPKPPAAETPALKSSDSRGPADKPLARQDTLGSKAPPSLPASKGTPATTTKAPPPLPPSKAAPAPSKTAGGTVSAGKQPAPKGPCSDRVPYCATRTLAARSRSTRRIRTPTSI